MKNKAFLIINVCFNPCLLLLAGIILSLSLSSQTKTTAKIISSKQTVVKAYKNSDSLHVSRQANKLIKKWKRKGYINSAIDSITINNDCIVVYTYRGEKYFLKSFRIDIPDNLSHLIPKTSKPRQGKEIDIVKLKNFRGAITSSFENNGYPFVSVATSSSVSDQQVDLIINIKPGKEYFFDTIAIPEGTRISKKFLMNYLDIKPGEPYREKSISEINKKINQLTFLKSKDNGSVTFQGQKAYPEIFMENKKANRFDGLIGFAPDNENKNKMVVTGEFELGLLNSLGRGEKVYLKWKKSDRYSQLLQTNLNWPYIFNTFLGVDGKLDLLKQDTSFLNLDMKAGAYVYFNGYNYLQGFYKKKESIVLNPEDTISIMGSNTNSSGIELVSQKSNNHLNPAKGYYLQISASAGIRKAENQKNKSSFYDLGITGKLYLPLYKNFIIMAGNSFRGIYSSQPFYWNELIQLGGSNTIRGFDEDQFRVSSFNYSTLEIRYLFEKNSHLKLFTHLGWIETQYLSTSNTDFPISIGTGINLNTKAGIFTLGYAVGKVKKTNFNMNNSKVHIGYINNF